MKKIIIGVLAMGAFSAQASMLEINGPLDATFYETQVNDEKTHFETLGDLFKVGTKPNISKISNIAWAGRCFLKDKPNDPTNAGYIFRKKAVSDAGPIGANLSSYESISYWKREKAPNFFDSLSLEQVYALNLRAAPFSALIKQNSIQIDMDSKYRSNLKVSGSYLVEEITDLSRDVGPLEEEVHAEIRCYYFIPELKP